MSWGSTTTDAGHQSSFKGAAETPKSVSAIPIINMLYGVVPAIVAGDASRLANEDA